MFGSDVSILVIIVGLDFLVSIPFAFSGVLGCVTGKRGVISVFFGVFVGHAVVFVGVVLFLSVGFCFGVSVLL